jgi:hypothetical protein
MSRLDSLSANAIAKLFSPESDDVFITLLTISGSGFTTIRIADNYTTRLSETSEDIVYGVQSNLGGATTYNFVYLPFSLSLPTEEFSSAPRCNLTVQDVTRYLIPTIRSISSAPSVQIDIVLASDPDVVEVTFGSFLIGNINYNANTVSAELVVESLAVEPFPQHTFNPSYFPGLF